MKKPSICDRIVPIEDIDAYRKMKREIKKGGDWWNRCKSYGVHAYRVTGFYKIIPLKHPRIGYKGRLINCNRKEADYVSGYGVCGIIRPINQVVVEGQVEWTTKQKQEARQDARNWIKRESEIHFMTRIYVKDDGKLETF